MSQKRRTAFLVVAVAVGIAFLLRKRHTTPHFTRELKEPAITMDPDLGQFLTAVNTANDETEAAYVNAVARLRERATELITEIERVSGVLPKADYAAHRSLVLAAGAMQHTASLSYLRSVVFRTGGTTSVPGHNTGEAVEETALRALAVEAIEELAAVTQEQKAMETLVEVVHLPSLTLRALSLVALRTLDKEGQYLERAAALLPDNQQYLLKVRRQKVTDVFQIPDARVHLHVPERGVPGPPPLPEDAQRFKERPLPTGRNDAPKLAN